MSKLFFILLWSVAWAGTAGAQQNKYSTFYYQRATLFEELPVTSSDIVFLGNSITNGAEWGEIFRNPHVKNRGISGDIAEGVYDRLGAITKGKPKKIFLLVGINDVARGTAADTIVKRIGKIVRRIKEESPRTKIYIQSLLPVNDRFGMFGGHTSRGNVVLEVNRQLVELAKNEAVTYIDLYSHFKNKDGEKLNPEYTNDGLHLLGKGYMLWKKIVEKYI